jgi:ribosome-binding factor A
MSSQSPRAGRVARTLQLELAEMIRGLKDPRIAAAGPASINHVDVNRDMSVATIYVSFIGAGEGVTAAAVEALGRATSALRGPLARRLHLRRAPELRFFADSSVEFTARLSEIVAEDTARAVPDEATPDQATPDQVTPDQVASDQATKEEEE